MELGAVVAMLLGAVLMIVPVWLAWYILRRWVCCRARSRCFGHRIGVAKVVAARAVATPSWLSSPSSSEAGTGARSTA